MLGKPITYKDLDGNDVTETFWFHLSRAEMAEMALAKEGKAGGFDAWIRTMIQSQDGEVLTKTFKDILLATIGERSSDNKRFIKNDEIRNNFLYSDAYSVLFMELMMDADKMAEFINGVVPKDMQEETQKNIQQAVASGDIPGAQGPQARVEEKRVSDVPPPTVNATPEPKDDRPDWLKEGRVPTEKELQGAKPEYIMEAFKLKSQSSNSSQ